MVFNKENFDITNREQVIFVTERAFTLFSQMRDQIKVLSTYCVIQTNQASEEQVTEYLRDNWLKIITCQPFDVATNHFEERVYNAAYNFISDWQERQDLKEVLSDPAFAKISLQFFTGN